LQPQVLQVYGCGVSHICIGEGMGSPPQYYNNH
jgi:hypothetical protein